VEFASQALAADGQEHLLGLPMPSSDHFQRWNGQRASASTSGNPVASGLAPKCTKTTSRYIWLSGAKPDGTEHDRHYGAIHRLTDWMTMLFYDPSPVGAAQRARTFPLLAEEWVERVPDTIGLGPEAPSDEAARRRLFGED
jgi:hypothetical protein